MLKHEMWKLLQTAKENRLFLQVAFNVDYEFGSKSQNKGIIITLRFVYLVNKLVYHDPNG